MSTIVLDPITRLEGHLKISVTLDASNTVTAAEATGNLYRGFENMLVGRNPGDAAFLTQRICGVCPVSHAIASSKATEQAGNFTPNLQGLLLRDLIQGANFIASNILHFYQLALLDYVQGPAMHPWTPGYSQDFRFSAADSQTLMANYVTALSIRRQAQEMGAIFGGKLPHVGNVVPGGVTASPSSADIANFSDYLGTIKAFIQSEYNADVNKLATAYSDYYQIGKGYGNLISYGVFDTNITGTQLFPAGTVTNGAVGSFDAANIKEYVGHSWYSSPSGANPSSETTTPSYGKSGAYTWLKAPRYNDVAYEAGSLARTWVSGDYRNGISVMDRHLARYTETSKIATNMATWLSQLQVGVSGYTNMGTVTSSGNTGSDSEKDSENKTGSESENSSDDKSVSETDATTAATVVAAAATAVQATTSATGVAAPATPVDATTAATAIATNATAVVAGTGIGLTEAPRGALGHWVTIAASKISQYQIVTPTCWNASPMDDAGNVGPIEMALIGVNVANSAEPVELLRIVHSFDPCTGCSVHVMSPEGIEMSNFIVQPL
ncbi:nickel-dependent hydrogenase large subunit [Acetobacterium sp.]|uniref:nickel-dependent hydrogenase large subunit n=1 Tax=Acetobacterium sp. TaxID=1872094 RepID=UPI002F42B4DC